MDKVTITGIGAYIPSRRITNQDWYELAGSDDSWFKWIIESSGIVERSRIEPESTIADMGVKASLKALTLTNCNNPESIDLIICATSTPDAVLPSTASKIQSKLSAVNATSFDINASCAGWLFGMRTAVAMIQSKQAEKVLVVGTEAHSRIVNFYDRTNIIFGDAAGAAILERGHTKKRSNQKLQKKDLTSPIFSTGTIPSLSIQLPTIFREQYNSMEEYIAHNDMGQIERPLPEINGKVVRQLAFQSKKSMDRVMKMAREFDITIGDIDMFVPHQTTISMVQDFCDHISYPFEKIPYTLDKYGSIGSASIPVSISEHFVNGKIQKGDLILCHTFGAGFTYGSMLFEWGI